MAIDSSRLRAWAFQLGFITLVGPVVGYLMAIAAQSLIEVYLGR